MNFQSAQQAPVASDAVLEAKNEELRKQINFHGEKLDEVKAELDKAESLKQDISTLEGTLDILVAQKKEADESLASLRSELDGLLLIKKSNEADLHEIAEQKDLYIAAEKSLCDEYEKKLALMKEEARNAEERLSIADSSLLSSKIELEKTKKEHEELVSLESSLKKSIESSKAALLVLNEELSALASQKASISNDVASSKAEMLNMQSMLLAGKAELGQSKNERDAVQEEVLAMKDKVSLELKAREEGLIAKEASLAKREAWNEDVRKKLVLYKSELETYYKREFKDLII